MNKLQKEKLFKDFLLKNKIMIVDRSSASRKRLAKTLSDNDAKMINVKLFSRYEEAVEALEEFQPALILSDYHLGDGSGFDLFRKYREMKTDESNAAVLVLITSNVSQSAVAKAAEEDVDSFIIKPYTLETLTQGLINAFINKLHPSDYMKKIEEGKEKLFAQEIEEAESLFYEAKELSKKPSLACFYIGQCEYIREAKQNAESEYKEGISYNKIHYKCQIGLYDMYYKDKMYDEAYEIVKNIAKYFPANPDRLNNIVRLAVITQNFQDMNYYYEIFKSLEMRERQTIKYICAGLLVAGKYYLRQEKEDEALQLFQKIAISSAGETRFYRAMIENLLEYGLQHEAQKIYSRFDSDEKLTQDYAISEFLMEHIGANDERIAQMGTEFIENELENYLCFKIIIKSFKRCGYISKADELYYKMIELYPEQQEEINSYYTPDKSQDKVDEAA
jgi:CheY-like chemotaxis protein